jgi:replication factor A1
MIDDITKDVDEILRSVDKEVNRTEIEANLRKFLEYGVPLQQAKKALIQKYGGGIFVQEKKIEAVEINDKKLSVTGKIVALDEREVEVRGEKRKIFRGLFGDETAVIPFTAWKDFNMRIGDLVKIKNAYAGEWDGQPRLNFSEWTEIEKIEGDIEVAQRPPRLYEILELKPGYSNVEVKARVLTLEEREVTTDTEKKVVYSGIMGDSTGKIRYSSWKDFDFHEGDVVHIIGSYVSSWRGAPQLVFDDKASVEKIDQKEIPEELIGRTCVPLHKLNEVGGGVDVCIEGVVIELQGGSGIVFRCPKCNRVITEGICVIDGEVKGNQDLRIKAIVDDGTGTVLALFNREITEKILGKNLEEYGDDVEAVEHELETKLLTKLLSLSGNAFSDEYGTTLLVTDAEILKVHVGEEAEKVLAELEE